MARQKRALTSSQSSAIVRFGAPWRALMCSHHPVLCFGATTLQRITALDVSMTTCTVFIVACCLLKLPKSASALNHHHPSQQQANMSDLASQVLAQGVPPGVPKPCRAPADHGGVSKYTYLPLLQPNSIRLLRLLPSNRDSDSLRGELLEYHLRKSDKPSYHYEALSYFWGGERKPQSISIYDPSLKSRKRTRSFGEWEGARQKTEPLTLYRCHEGTVLNITQNLYTALLRLRDHGCSRMLWVDAVCINQEDEKEKEKQIPLMAEIFAKALRVVVWLGEAEAGSDQALEAIRLANENSVRLPNTEPTQDVIRQLLTRPWFQRIWVRDYSSDRYPY